MGRIVAGVVGASAVDLLTPAVEVELALFLGCRFGVVVVFVSPVTEFCLPSLVLAVDLVGVVLVVVDDDDEGSTDVVVLMVEAAILGTYMWTMLF